MGRELAPLPPEAICVKMQTGLEVHLLIGEPRDIEDDGLILFTDDRYKIHNCNFRADLNAMAGQGYQQDAKLLRATNSEVTSGDVIMINGYNLPYCVVVLVPINTYKKGDDVEDYRIKIWNGDLWPPTTKA